MHIEYRNWACKNVSLPLQFIFFVEEFHINEVFELLHPQLASALSQMTPPSFNSLSTCIWTMIYLLTNSIYLHLLTQAYQTLHIIALKEWWMISEWTSEDTTWLYSDLPTMKDWQDCSISSISLNCMCVYVVFIQHTGLPQLHDIHYLMPNNVEHYNI